MQGAQLENEDNKCVDNLVLFMTKKEGKNLLAVVEKAAEQKIKGSKPLLKKLEAVLYCY